MTLEVLRQLYDSTRYRVSEYRFPPGTSLRGRTRAVCWFILDGSGTVDGVDIEVGDVVELNAGDYAVETRGAKELHIVKVWDLAPFMN